MRGGARKHPWSEEAPFGGGVALREGPEFQTVLVVRLPENSESAFQIIGVLRSLRPVQKIVGVCVGCGCGGVGGGVGAN